MKTCNHGVLVGKYCARCPRVSIPYVYSREQVIVLNEIRARQGHRPLTGRETYEIVDGKRTGRVLGEDGKPL